MKTLEEITLEITEAINMDFADLNGDDLPAFVCELTRRVVAALGAQKAAYTFCLDETGMAYLKGVCVSRHGDKLFTAPVLPSVQEGWTSVNDKLPDTNGAFLVICDKGIQSYHPIIGIFDRNFDSPYPWSVPGTASVTHWMQLPPAPSPQEDKP